MATTRSGVRGTAAWSTLEVLISEASELKTSRKQNDSGPSGMDKKNFRPLSQVLIPDNRHALPENTQH